MKPAELKFESLGEQRVHTRYMVDSEGASWIRRGDGGPTTGRLLVAHDEAQRRAAGSRRVRREEGRGGGGHADDANASEASKIAQRRPRGVVADASVPRGICGQGECVE